MAMKNYFCSTMKISARTGVIGARHHRYIALSPVDNKILMFILSIRLIEFYIIYSIRNLAKNILYICIHSVIIEV